MTNYVFNEGKMFMDISDGIAVVINSETGIYYGMNEFGTMLFDALTRGAAVEQIRVALKSVPDVPADIDAKLDVFVGELVKFEIIVPGAGNDGEVTLDGAVAKADNFVMEVKAYDDAQEMLLADPIHEVKEETGWTPEKDSIGYSKEETKEREKKVEA